MEIHGLLIVRGLLNEGNCETYRGVIDKVLDAPRATPKNQLTEEAVRSPYHNAPRNLADYFDAMTTARVYQDPLTPDKALRFILERSGEIFDPFLAKVFIHAMGVYPIGTVVELNTGETAVVIRQNDIGVIHRPVVKILDESSSPADAIQVDLAQRGSDGRFERSVVKAFYDAKTELLKTRFFVNE